MLFSKCKNGWVKTKMVYLLEQSGKSQSTKICSALQIKVLTIGSSHRSWVWNYSRLWPNPYNANYYYYYYFCCCCWWWWSWICYELLSLEFCQRGIDSGNPVARRRAVPESGNPELQNNHDSCAITRLLPECLWSRHVNMTFDPTRTPTSHLKLQL
jgi:hypothetical protein